MLMIQESMGWRTSAVQRRGVFLVSFNHHSTVDAFIKRMSHGPCLYDFVRVVLAGSVISTQYSSSFERHEDHDL